VTSHFSEARTACLDVRRCHDNATLHNNMATQYISPPNVYSCNVITSTVRFTRYV